ncbi:activator of HSP90 ATPase [Aquimarina sp. BL5]|uniref:SRPBCC family protein n=1 Tax=Aquimarina sp. BL5 TaxID=1714860 RepID=UPI000E5244E3|nr:SRPBCC domain-containing protein [Aquimarina sp. BL5]AXT49944.1 activator of HSP90 ATPase [Aquimarina sp. BL5]RKN07469.1 activator of HSP90 ATPase [Aquimarina sp. BL5]
MSNLNNRTLSLKRTFNAPIKLVWEAWSQSEHIAQWWGPKGMETKIIEHNFSEGGTWKYAMLMPDGNEFIADGIYTEIVAFQKIISSANFKPMTEGVEIQALFEEDGDKTNFTFNVVHATEEYCQQQEKMGFMNGWGSVFDRLGVFVQVSD